MEDTVYGMRVCVTTYVLNLTFCQIECCILLLLTHSHCRVLQIEMQWHVHVQHGERRRMSVPYFLKRHTLFP